MSTPYISDRRRRELAVLPRILWSLCRHEGMLVEEPGEEGSIARLMDALGRVQDEAFIGLVAEDADKAERQIRRVTKAVIHRAGLEDQPGAKIVAAVWQVFAHLIEHGALDILEGSAMAEVVSFLEPAHQHVYETPAFARSASRTARRLMKAIHDEGLWWGVPAMGEREAA